MTTDAALAHKVRTQRRMRITCGYRTGAIAGGPQAEKPMIRAASKAGSHAAYAAVCGCRGCIARGQWPGHMETTAHCMHACVTGNVRDIVGWRAKIIKKLKYLATLAKKIGEGARTLKKQLELAVGAMCQVHPQGQGYTALRHTVGGAVPQWDTDKEDNDKEYNKTIMTVITEIQDLYSERLGEWETCMAPWGHQRQNRWDRRDWTRLIFTAIKHNTTGKWARRRALRRIGAMLIHRYRDEATRENTRTHNRRHREEKRKLRWKLRRVLWGIYYDPVTYMLLATEERPKAEWIVGAVEQWVDKAHEKGKLVYRIKHAMRCLQMYIHTVARPRERACREKENKQRTVKAARQRLLRRAYSIYKNELQLQMLEDRAEQRRGLVCAHTRQADKVVRVYYSETTEHRGRRILETEMYRLNRWPRRDKCGPALVELLYYVWGIT